MKNKTRFLFIIELLLIYACSKDLPVIDSWDDNSYNLVSQNNQPVKFPDILKGKISVVGYIYTNCPSICPLTTNNMRLIQKKVKEDGIDNVEFITISFDPENDTPAALRDYARLRKLNLSNWIFLTGSKSTIDSLIKEVGVFAIKSDSTVLQNGKKIYNFVHTDRISLVDKNGRIRKNYQGSKINISEIVDDIKSLSN
ncbi:SCO family protein [Melioribacteraceae bacterium 4301-Me]|uniref:SCO family protein n=1 Tax=Pyranulibacter aquaticus TaxID=3163344 RepID=UPI003597E0D5